MAGFFSKLFGGGKSSKKGGSEVEMLLRDTVENLVSLGDFAWDFDIDVETQGEETTIRVNFSGDDSELLKDRQGQLIDALQLYLKRVIQHHFPDDKTGIAIDCQGFREESNQELIDLAEKLKGVAIEKGRSVYFRALPPKDRKVIHQYLSQDTRVKSRSIGEGLYKKIKIYPSKEGYAEDNSSAE